MDHDKHKSSELRQVSVNLLSAYVSWVLVLFIEVGQNAGGKIVSFFSVQDKL